MTQWVNVTLDTTAPQLVLGSVSYAIAGQTIVIPYTSDEPVASGELILPDAREVALTVTAGTLRALIPADCPRGFASIRVRDDLDNAAVYSGLHVNGLVVNVTLDTTAPTVSFGAATGTATGAFFQIAYTTDEPVAAATLTSGAHSLALNVTPTTMNVQLPGNWPDGMVAIEVADDLANTRLYTNVVRISGPEVAAIFAIRGPAVATGTTLAAPPPRARPRLVAGRSRLLTRTRDVLRTAVATRSTSAPATRATVSQLVVSNHRLAVTSDFHVATTRIALTATASTTRGEVVARGESHHNEAILLELV